MHVWYFTVGTSYRLKRFFDIVLSLAALAALSPFLLAVAVWVKLDSSGPVIYRQVRVGRFGRHFRFYKFRTMRIDADRIKQRLMAENQSADGVIFKMKRDPRVTRIGRYLRKFSIDELPQLLNILNGDMTLVGPRPERPEFYQKYCAEYPEFAYRLRAKAGLTGYAQLYGKYNTTFADKALLDMYYIQKASFLWDLQLIFYTLKIIFVKESTEGVETKPAEPEKKEPACAGESK